MYILSLIVSLALSMGIGFFWYSPKLFGNLWLRSMGIDPTTLPPPNPRGMLKIYGYQAITVLFTALTLHHFVTLLDVHSFAGALEFALFIWFGIQVPLLAIPVLYEKRPIIAFIIHTLYYLVATLAMTLAITFIN